MATWLYASLEAIIQQTIGRPVELLRDSTKDIYMFRFTTPDKYRDPAERAVDEAWERFVP